MQKFVGLKGKTTIGEKGGIKVDLENNYQLIQASEVLFDAVNVIVRK